MLAGEWACIQGSLIETWGWRSLEPDEYLLWQRKEYGYETQTMVAQLLVHLTGVAGVRLFNGGG
jgi:hypothetical protein